jgi:hypothetical protein
MEIYILDNLVNRRGLNFTSLTPAGAKILWGINCELKKKPKLLHSCSDIVMRLEWRGFKGYFSPLSIGIFMRTCLKHIPQYCSFKIGGKTNSRDSYVYEYKRKMPRLKKTWIKSLKIRNKIRESW